RCYALGEARAEYLGDPAPVLGGRDAGATELEDDERSGSRGHAWGGRPLSGPVAEGLRRTGWRRGLAQASSSKSCRAFLTRRSASTSSSLLQAALPFLPTGAFLRSTRSISRS